MKTNLLDVVSIIILSISLPIILWEFFQTYWNKVRISQGKYPKLIVDFPTHETNVEKYGRAKYKIENFCLDVLSNKSVEVVLTSDDINSLIDKGCNLNKYEPGTYAFYLIRENKLEKQYLQWPSFPGHQGCWSRTSLIDFEKCEAGKIYEICQIIEELGKAKNNVISRRELSRSPLIRAIFGISESVDILTRTNSGTTDYQRSLKVINKISGINVCQSGISIHYRDIEIS